MLLFLALPEDLLVCHSRISSHSYSLSGASSWASKSTIPTTVSSVSANSMAATSSIRAECGFTALLHSAIKGKIVTGAVKKVRTVAECIQVLAAAGAAGSGVQASLMKAHAVDDMQPTIPQIEDQHMGAMTALADTVANAVTKASAAVAKRSGIASGVIKSTYSKSHDNATATEVPSGESAHDLNNTRPQKFLRNTQQSCR
ncbi:unnamed protein product [Allacma fusca]|uniref:Uncharacterized protein n=1 Tax=Allacma fusca TaxID=39272 RepID=A0A8J2LEM8_9HEXA|nr:unnamed protein product [Allacma fusca]